MFMVSTMPELEKTCLSHTQPVHVMTRQKMLSLITENKGNFLQVGFRLMDIALFFRHFFQKNKLIDFLFAALDTINHS